MRLFNTISYVAFSISLSACANLNTVHRSLDLSSDNNAKAVAIDGYQQPIFAQYIDIDENGNQIGVDSRRKAFIVCPNPPVEAITANGLSAALTNGFKAGKAAAGAGPTNDTQAALVNAVAAASIGLRTNSTTLLSYNSTANCLAYMGGATKDRKFMELARRNQHITMAILAIEQLTGVAQAGQASMSTSGSSATGAENLVPLQNSLDNAQKDANTAKTTLASALTDRDKAVTDLEAKIKSRKAAELKEAELKKAKAPQDQLDGAAKEVADAKDAEAISRETVTTSTKAYAAASLEIKRTDEHVKRAQTAIELAERAVRAQADSMSQVGQGQGPRASATSAVAKAVVDIVKISTAAIGEGETCAAIMDDYRLAKTDAELAKWNSTAGQYVLASCAIERVQAARDRGAVGSTASASTDAQGNGDGSTKTTTATDLAVAESSKDTLATKTQGMPEAAVKGKTEIAKSSGSTSKKKPPAAIAPAPAPVAPPPAPVAEASPRSETPPPAVVTSTPINADRVIDSLMRATEKRK